MSSCCFSCANQMLQPARGVPVKKGGGQSLPPALTAFPPVMQQRMLCMLQSGSRLNVQDVSENLSTNAHIARRQTRPDMRSELSSFLLE